MYDEAQAQFYEWVSGVDGLLDVLTIWTTLGLTDEGKGRQMIANIWRLHEEFIEMHDRVASGPPQTQEDFELLKGL